MLAFRDSREPMPGRALTAAEKAREPRSLAIVAWYDGWGQGQGMRPGNCGTYARRLTAAEQAEWRAGYAEGRACLLAHREHGFARPAETPPEAGTASATPKEGTKQ